MGQISRSIERISNYCYYSLKTASTVRFIQMLEHYITASVKTSVLYFSISCIFFSFLKECSTASKRKRHVLVNRKS